MILIVLAALLSGSSIASASELSTQLQKAIRSALEEKVNHAEIRLPSLEKVVQAKEFSTFSKIVRVRLIEDRPTGVAIVEVIGDDATAAHPIIQTPYEAWVKVPVALHRIYPNTKLKSEDFKVGSVNVASGPAREYRGILADASTNFDRMESHQTILENQFVINTSIRKQPDVRRGDTVRLELVSGELSLTTQGVVQEAGSAGDRIRVLTVKTKKEITGIVQADRTVEVNL